MKKPYIVPESRLFAINLKENIADSIFNNNGDDSIAATAFIMFTHGVDPCRGYYTGSLSAPVSPNIAGSTNFMDYYNDLRSTGDLQAYWDCFHHKSSG